MGHKRIHLISKVASGSHEGQVAGSARKRIKRALAKKSLSEKAAAGKAVAGLRRSNQLKVDEIASQQAFYLKKAYASSTLPRRYPYSW